MKSAISSRKQIGFGAILSYILLALNTIYGLLVTPFILRNVGDTSYGVYKTISSLSASLAVLDLGLGTTMTRYMARFHALNESEKANKFTGMIFGQFGLISIAIIFVSLVFYFLIPNIYGGTFNFKQIEVAKILFAILILNMILRLAENLFFGIVNGHEHFILSNGIKVINVTLKFSLIFVLLPIFKNVYVIVLSETALVCLTIVIFAFYSFNHMKIRPKFGKWDMSLFRESFVYTILMFLQSLTIQLNGNIDNILIGSNLGPALVTIYSMSLIIFNMYENLSGSIATIMLPSVTKKVVEKAPPESLQKSIEKAGRYQFYLLAAALGGFVVLGNDFFYLWLGSGFTDCYYLTLILIIPVTVTMIQNVALSVLRAQNKMVYRTITLLISCAVNFVVTFVGIKLWGYWGAAIGTACSTLLNLIFMNVYYAKVLHFHVFKMTFNIIQKTLTVAVVTAVITRVFHTFFNSSWISFVLNVIVFMSIYLILIVVFALPESDKNYILKKVRIRK